MKIPFGRGGGFLLIFGLAPLLRAQVFSWIDALRVIIYAGVT